MFVAKTQLIQIADIDRFNKFFDLVLVKFIISKGIECFEYFLYTLELVFPINLTIQPTFNPCNLLTNLFL